MAPVAASFLLVALVLRFRGEATAPTLRATAEALLMVCALTSAWFIWRRFCLTRSVSAALVLIAVLALALNDLAFFAVPSVLGSRSSSAEAAAPMIGELVVAGAFVLAAIALRTQVASVRQAVKLLLKLLAIYSTVLVTCVLAWDGHSAVMAAHTSRTPPGEPITLTLAAICLLLIAATVFMWSAARPTNGTIAGLLGGSSLLLAAAWGYGLLAPGLTTSSVSGRELLRAAGYGLLLIVALECRKQTRRAQIGEAVAAERRRVVRDLHDGMAQDLAFIAVHGERLIGELGAEHPLVLAARRALTASRGVIADLSASKAPTTGDALRSVASELSSRHQVRVKVDTDGDELPPEEREEVVRIAREATVNAIRHGRARNILVLLKARGRHFSLKIRDDGTGLVGRSDRSHNGHGLLAMRERAEAMGGELSVQRAPTGGTEVEVSVS